MAEADILFVISGSFKRWTSGYVGISDLTLSQLLVELRYASRSIEFELLSRQDEPSLQGTPTASQRDTPDNGLSNTSSAASKAQQKVQRDKKKLTTFYDSLRDTANTINEDGVLDYIVVPGSEKGKAFTDAIDNLQVPMQIPGQVNWSSDTFKSMLWMVRKFAGPACMFLVLHCISPRQIRSLGIHAVAKFVQHVVEHKCTLFCSPLEQQYNRLVSNLCKRTDKRKRDASLQFEGATGHKHLRVDSNKLSWDCFGMGCKYFTCHAVLIPLAKSSTAPMMNKMCAMTLTDLSREGVAQDCVQTEAPELTMLEGYTMTRSSSSCPIDPNAAPYVSVPGCDDPGTPGTCPRMSEPPQDVIQPYHENGQGLRESSSSCVFERSTAAMFCAGISIEDTFNRNSTLVLERPYDAPIFVVVQEGDIPSLRNLLGNGNASIYDVDPYGLGLLYVSSLRLYLQAKASLLDHWSTLLTRRGIQYASYYCWKSYGAERAMQMCSTLLSYGISTRWTDDIGNSPVETMLDSALIYSAMSGGAAFEFGSFCAEIGSYFKMALAEIGTQYLSTRGFSELHQVLLGIDQNVTLTDFLHSLEQSKLDKLINLADSRGRTALTWAVEFGWSSAAQILLGFGADPNCSQRGNLTPLHLAVAGPQAQFSKQGFLDVIDHLLEAGADVNAKDDEGWTPLHIAASWGLCDLQNLFSRPELEWNVITNDNMSVDDLSQIEGGFSKAALSRLYEG